MSDFTLLELNKRLLVKQLTQPDDYEIFKQLVNGDLKSDKWFHDKCTDKDCTPWRMVSHDKITLNSTYRSYEGIELSFARLYSGVTFEMTIPAQWDKIADVKAVAVYDDLGDFQGFTSTSLYTIVLYKFCKTLMKEEKEPLPDDHPNKSTGNLQ